MDVSLTVIPESISVPFCPVEEVTLPMMEPEAKRAVYPGCCAKKGIAQNRVAIKMAARIRFLMQSLLSQQTFHCMLHTFIREDLDLAMLGRNACCVRGAVSRNSIHLFTVCRELLHPAVAFCDAQKNENMTDKLKIPLKAWRHYIPLHTQQRCFLRRHMRNVCSSCSRVSCTAPSVRLGRLSQRVTDDQSGAS